MSQPQRGQPLLYRKVVVPDELLTPWPTDADQRFGGDVRIGDLDGNGQVDFVLFKSVAGGMKPCFIGAFTLDGEVLWTYGDSRRAVRTVDSKEAGVQWPARPGPVAIGDLDGDGRMEVLAFMLEPGAAETHQWVMDDIEIIVLDGETGELKKRARPAELRAADAKIDGKVMPANYVHQRLFLADLRGTGQPRDFVVKVGKTVFAFDGELQLLWSYESQHNIYPRHNAYIPAVGDIDGDGRDEVLLGHALLDDDGQPLWEQYLGDNMDSVAIVPWADGKPRAILSAGGRVVDEHGTELFSLGMEMVPHGQEIRCGNVLAECPGPELVVRFDGHAPELMVVGSTCEILNRFPVQPSPNNTGLELIHWNGPDEPALIYSPAALYDGRGSEVAAFADLPEPSGDNQGWYHCIPADVCGDEREELILYDPCADAIYIYTPAPLDEGTFSGYVHGPRQYNVRLMD